MATKITPRKYPQIRIRSIGDRFAVRWILGAGKPAHRAVVPTFAIAAAVRDAVRAGDDGWRALAGATMPPAEADGQADALAAIHDAVAAGLVSWQDVEREVTSLRTVRADRADRQRRIAAGEPVQNITPAVAAARAAKGGKARASNMTPERRREIATKAAASRWKAVAAANEVPPALPPAVVTTDDPTATPAASEGPGRV